MNWQGTEQFFRFCKYIFGVSLFGLYTAMLFSKPLRVYALETDNNIYATPATRLEDWRFNPEALQLEIVLSSATQPQYFFLAQPSRIVVDIPGTKLGYVPTQQNYSGAVQSIRVSQFNADVTRIVLDLAPGTALDRTQMQLEPISRQNPTRWVLRPSIASDRTYSPTGNLLPPSGNFPPTNITPPLPNDLPPGVYPPQPPENLQTDYSPQPSGYLPPDVYPPQPPENLQTDTYSPQPSGYLPPGVYPPQPSGNLQTDTYSPQPSGYLPPG
ncbi:MAG: AMIN domain-containing protein, partial [Scytonema sp. PMC 1069.18]|nr:AMIN domain-containing protein [Scytonema sp. PMC 1069.18]MEC4886207.1 AMIN domain-containing protein [Scytonema sp. PMC 1070.18]